MVDADACSPGPLYLTVELEPVVSRPVIGQFEAYLASDWLMVNGHG